MSDTKAENTPVVPTDLPSTRADEVSGRPSQKEIPSETDRLKNTSQMSSCNDSYSQLRLPEGLQGQEENFASFKRLASELNLPAETVQKLMQWEADIACSEQKKADGQRADILQKWMEQSKELFGPSYAQDIARALETADRFGGAELRQLLEVTGLGNHPVIVKTFHQISQLISEDNSISGRTRHSTDKTFAEALYGKAS